MSSLGHKLKKMTSIKTKCNSKDILDRAKLVLKIEFEEIQAVSDKLDKVLLEQLSSFYQVMVEL